MSDLKIWCMLWHLNAGTLTQCQNLELELMLGNQLFVLDVFEFLSIFIELKWGEACFLFSCNVIFLFLNENTKKNWTITQMIFMQTLFKKIHVDKSIFSSSLPDCLSLLASCWVWRLIDQCSIHTFSMIDFGNNQSLVPS